MKITNPLEATMSYQKLDSNAFATLLKAELGTVVGSPAAWAHLAPRITKRSPRHVWRWTLAAGLAGAAVVLAAGAAFAVSSLTGGHIIIHRVPTAVSGSGKPLPMAITRPFTTTLADAEQRAGFTALTLAGDNQASLQRVLYAPSSKGRGGSIDLVYQIAGAKVQVVEWLDTRGADAPLDVYLKDYPTGLLGAGSSIDKDTIESIGGSEYLFLRSPDGGRVDTVVWKTGNGVVVHLSPAYSENYHPNGLDRQTILEVISHLQ
jgi:hypothetical protein